jgi:hypothetical protein
LQDKNINNQCYSQSAGKKRFFSTLLHLFPFLRFSSFKRDQVSISATTIENPIIIGVDQKAGNKIIPSSTSRCRRSAARNFNQIQSEENPSSKLNHLEQKASIYRQSIYLQFSFTCYLLLRCHSIFQKPIIRVYPSSILVAIFEKLVRIDVKVPVIDIMNANISIERNKNIFDPL